MLRKCSKKTLEKLWKAQLQMTE
ncbi:unnamed protein product [Callosobruchus maculatus]|uniref:Uncharacterized protein n=1 Tax=Callosobruchus maculatus TaxID=64391 RepID=A0A653CLX0_CALMS|nr:unnamed protein product [Callosobruchus maculatus]